MASSTAISSLRSKLEFFPCRFGPLKSLKPVSSPKFPISKLAFSGGLDPKKAHSLRNRVMGSNNGMVQLVNLLPFRNNGNNHEEAVRVLQREDFDGSENPDPGIADNGLESTLNRLSKWLVSALLAVVILCRHDAEAMWAAMGSVVDTILSVVLKRILNQERPVPSLRSEPGMPSSHSQSIFYICTFAVFSIVEWLGINVISLIAGALVLAFGAYLSWLRVSQRLHTMSQVLVGAAIGTIFSILWHWSWTAAVHEAYTSFLWVRIVVILGAAGFCAGFLLYVLRYWIRDDRSKWLVPGPFVLGILCRHDAEALWAAMGSLVNIMLSIIIKQILNKERPTASFASELGVTSFHSQSVFYIVMFAISSIVQSMGINAFTLNDWTCLGIYLISFMVTSLTATSYAEPSGLAATIGTIFSILWYWSWDVAVHKPYVSGLSGFV